MLTTVRIPRLPGKTRILGKYAGAFPADICRSGGLCYTLDWLTIAAARNSKAFVMIDLARSYKFTTHPRQMTLMILGMVFSIETMIMMALPTDLEPRLGTVGVAVVDSLLLTIFLVPCLWVTIVRPLRQIAKSRQLLFNWAVSSEERKAGELARDLHDGIGQLVTAINVGLKTLEMSSSDRDVVEQTRRLREIGSELHTSVRYLARGLRPTILDDIGLGPAIKNYAQDISDTHGIPLSLDVSDLEHRRLSHDLETAVYRIIQEAVMNAVRHAKPQHIDLVVHLHQSLIELGVSDDGCGFEPAAVLNCKGKSQPFGIISMRERADLIGGHIQLISSLGHGTQIHVTLPLN